MPGLNVNLEGFRCSPGLDIRNGAIYLTKKLWGDPRSAHGRGRETRGQRRGRGRENRAQEQVGNTDTRRWTPPANRPLIRPTGTFSPAGRRGRSAASANRSGLRGANHRSPSPHGERVGVRGGRAVVFTEKSRNNFPVSRTECFMTRRILVPMLPAWERSSGRAAARSKSIREVIPDPFRPEFARGEINKIEDSPDASPFDLLR